jgi:hypothetical protein
MALCLGVFVVRAQKNEKTHHGGRGFFILIPATPTGKRRGS